MALGNLGNYPIDIDRWCIRALNSHRFVWTMNVFTYTSFNIFLKILQSSSYRTDKQCSCDLLCWEVYTNEKLEEKAFKERCKRNSRRASLMFIILAQSAPGNPFALPSTYIIQNGRGRRGKTHFQRWRCLKQEDINQTGFQVRFTWKARREKNIPIK